jgi:DNA polymerase III subunit delta
MTFDQIIKDLQAKKYSPVYFLHGDEPYYIDKISDYIEAHVLTEDEKAFNQHVLYGKETDKLSLVSLARRFPMMAQRQVVVVREAQDMRNLVPKKGDEEKTDKDALLDYVQNPSPTTVLVLCHKYKKVDGRSKLLKAVQKNAVLFESMKMWDNKLPDCSTNFVHSKKYRISPAAAVLLAEYLGNDLSKISGEIDQLMLNLKPETQITPEHIETYIGISKEYNVFEFQKAIGKKDVLKANRIAQHFAASEKENPFPVTMGSLYTYFNKILIYHSLKDKSRENVASSLGVNPYFVSEYETAVRNYPLEKTRLVI